MLKKLPLLKALASTLTAAMISSCGTLQAQVLWDNGPYFNSAGTGAGGANESVLYTTTFAMGTIGFGHQLANLNRVADEFTVPCSWRIDSIVFYAYQTGSTTTSTITSVNFRMWDSIPDAVGSTIVFGDTTTNRMVRTAWTGAYRITETTTGNTARPIMMQVCNVGGIIVGPGTYWLDWQTGGSLASGPWAPPRTPVGVAITGNGRQRVSGAWLNLVDGGAGTPAQGLPFIIYGESFEPSADAGSDQSLCPPVSVMLGGAPAGTGGLGPVISYTWMPGSSLSDSAVSNPVATPGLTTQYVLTVVDSGGCSATDTVLITVGSVSGDFLNSDTAICAGDTVPLISSLSGVTYLWSNGDTNSTINAAAGIYTLSVTDILGCVSVDTVVVTNRDVVTILGDSTFCDGDSLLLTASITPGTYIWSNGATDVSISVTSGGAYSVVAVDSAGCTSGDTVTVSAIPNPVAAFTYAPGAGGLDYTFTDMSTGSPTAWSWDFGDGGTSTATNPSHTYALDGTYNVTLIVSNTCGADTFVSTVTVVNAEGALDGSMITISPNPAKDDFTFEVSGMTHGDLHAELTDMQGRKLQTWKFESVSGHLKQQVNTRDFARGVYFLRFTSGTATQIQKVVLE